MTTELACVITLAGVLFLVLALTVIESRATIRSLRDELELYQSLFGEPHE
jgi:hypothetical protein